MLPQLRELVEEEGVGEVVELLGVRSDVPQLMQAHGPVREFQPV